MKRALWVVVAIGTVAATLACAADPLTMPVAQPLSTGSAAESVADEAVGRKLFSQNCARCHGFNMMNPAPGVFDLRGFPVDDGPRFLASVNEGKGAMPAWKNVLSPAEIESLWQYVRSAHST